MADPKVSVVLPVYNAEKTLRRAVESLLAQTFEDFDLWIVDDCSTDRSLDTIADLVGEDRVRLSLMPEHSGVVAAATLGVVASGGQFIARMDADDVCHPERLAKQVAMLEADPDLASVGCGVRIVGGGEGFERYAEWLNALTTPEDIAAQRFIESPVANPSAVFRRSAFEQAGGWRETEWAEDYDLFLRMLDAEMRISKVPDILLDWQDCSTRLTRTDERYSQDSFLRAKAHYLAKLQFVREGGVRICGAGPIGKRIARFLRHEGIAVHAFHEVHPRRIGERIGDVPVYDQSELSAADGASVVLSAVGIHGVREDVRRIVGALDYKEGVDFFCVA